MSDARLRELERRWKETQSPDDEAAYLLERVRVGDLTRERLELAAYCGHERARQAIQCNEFSLPLACLAVELLLPAISARSKAYSYTQRVLVAARAWVACPCPRHRQALELLQPLGGGWPAEFEAAHFLLASALSPSEEERLMMRINALACVQRSGSFNPLSEP